MFNRALAGRYEPGSTFKMLTATAGLETGVINEKTTVTCTGIYEFFAPSYRPKCWIFNDYGSSHGTLNVRQAIEKSCNIFFFETGRLVGIDRLNAYGKMFGLGQYTGIEVEGEAKGTLAGRENSTSRGVKWYDGDTIQAAIGQSDNLLTPLQLANYVATIANGGTHFQLHLLDEVKNYTMEKTIFKKEPAGENLNITSKTLGIVIDGMRKVTEDGTASSIFRNYPISVAGKTGTAQVSTGSSNGVFVAFAPVEDPQIAIAIVIEHGAHGNWAAPIAVDIMNAYFAKNTEKSSPVIPYTPLS
jgi:penicillin-binding protein 2